MSLRYTEQQVATIIGTTASDGTRTGWQLESTYQAEGTTKATKTIPTGGYTKLNLDVLYTEGSAETSNSIQIQLECSPDRINFYPLPVDTTSAPTSTLTAREWTFAGTNGAAASISFGVDIFYKYIRVSAKENGVASNKGNVHIFSTLSGQ